MTSNLGSDMILKSGEIQDIGFESSEQNKRTDNLEVKINDLIKITFPLLGMEGMHAFQGEIKSLNNDSEHLSFGIQFKDMNENIKGMIETYVNDVLDLN